MNHPKDDELKKIEEFIKRSGGTLGPGCCVFRASGALWNVSNVGDRPTCDSLVAQWKGEFVSYTQGQNCE